MDLELTPKDRLFLCNQYQILAQLGDPDARAYHLQMVDILRNGYVHEYSLLSDNFSNPLYEEDSEFVREVLAMFDQFEFAKTQSVAPPTEDAYLFEYRGFSANDELSYYSYAKYLVEQKGYPGLLKAKNSDSHVPSSASYRTLLCVWKSSGHDLARTEDFARVAAEVRELLASQEAGPIADR